MGMIKTQQPSKRAVSLPHEGSAIKKKQVVNIQPESYTLCGDTANVTIIQEPKRTHTKPRKI